MHHRVLSLVFAAALLLVPAASQANMPPPEPFMLGITAKMNNDGLLVTSLMTGSHSERAGLKLGDVILAANERYVKTMTPDELKELVDGLHHWREQLVVLRDGREVMVIEVRA